MIKSARKLLVKPLVTVGLSFCSAALPLFFFLGQGGVLRAREVLQTSPQHLARARADSVHLTSLYCVLFFVKKTTCVWDVCKCAKHTARGSQAIGRIIWQKSLGKGMLRIFGKYEGDRMLQ